MTIAWSKSADDEEVVYLCEEHFQEKKKAGELEDGDLTRHDGKLDPLNLPCTICTGSKPEKRVVVPLTEHQKALGRFHHSLDPDGIPWGEETKGPSEEVEKARGARK